MGKYRKNDGKSRLAADHDQGSSSSSMPQIIKRKLNATTIEQIEIKDLRARIEEECPARGYAPPLNQKVSFRSLPLSEATLRGLEDGDGKLNGGSNRGRGKRGASDDSDASKGNRKNNKSGHKKQFWIMTDIQNACIPHALKGRDILGAARTGSGKTLAFLIPLLEKLFRLQYTPLDGPGGIVLSPTRELAVQTFQVLRSVGSHHNFSAGLLVGGKKEFGMEQQHVGRMNIVIATPGRLLQHLEQTADLDVSRVVMLVLDEADRILDLGFRDQMCRILEYLPHGNKGTGLDDEEGGRQTMLFSATQTKKVSDLAALSLHRPEYLGVHDKEVSKTPESLEQSLIVVPLQHKLDAVFSFIKSHLRTKTIIFFSSCSQVRHVWSIFCTLQPGVPLMAIHGKLKQETRTKLYFDFLQRPHAVLFATDVAARGLDFPNVDWVVQADAPEDIDMYIHRVGRTARYTSGGKALLVLLPEEEDGMIKLIQTAKITIKKLNMNPKKALVVSKKAAAVVASNPDMNLLAKKAFKSYLRSIHLMPNKDVFPSVTSLPIEEYATSLGLASMPKTRFLKKIKNREEERKKKNVDYKLQRLKEEIKAERLGKKIAKLGGSANEKLQSKSLDKKRMRDEDSDSSDDEDDEKNGGLLVIKNVHEWGDRNDKSKSKQEKPLPDVRLNEASRSRHAKKIRIDGSSTGLNQRIVFNDDGEVEESMIDTLHVVSGSKPNDVNGAKSLTLVPSQTELASAKEEYLQKVRERLNKTKELDRMEEKERIQEKHRKRRLKEKGDLNNEEEGAVVTLGGHAEDDGDSDTGSSEDEGSSSNVEDGKGEFDLASGYGDSDSDGSGDDDDNLDVKAQEELALSMLHGR